tara:strand:- start:831 stop:1499 length:669 start_codon:yes stop_codon:yes gene_type:complete
MRAQEKKIRGFSLLELLVVIVIISVISAVAYPNFSSWKKEREVRGAAVKIKNLFTNINSQVQRGLYAFVQVELIENNDALTVISKGMNMNTLMVHIRGVDNWTTDMETRCNSTQTWDDEGSTSNRLEVAQLIFDDIAISFKEQNAGTVCFSKDGTWYSSAGALETDTFFFICSRSPTNSRCDVSDAGVPSVDLDNVFAINWSRFGNITIEKWSRSQDDWVLQ